MSLSSSKVVCSSHSDSMILHCSLPFSFLHTFKKREKQTNIDSFYVYVLYCVLGCETDEVYFVVVGEREREILSLWDLFVRIKELVFLSLPF